MHTMYRVTRRYITLIEIMIVMTLIAMILGVVAYNFQGALQEGNAFTTRQRIEKIQTIISLKMASDPKAADQVGEQWKEWVKESPLVRSPDEAVLDGWGQEFQIEVRRDSGTGTKVVVTSERLKQYDDQKE